MSSKIKQRGAESGSDHKKQIQRVGLLDAGLLKLELRSSSSGQSSTLWLCRSQALHKTLMFPMDWPVSITKFHGELQYLAAHADWLGGEFYLAHENDIETAWQMGCAAVDQQV